MEFERFSPVERRIRINGSPVSIWRPPDMEALIDLAAFENDERIPYWADVWESAIVLAEELAEMDGSGLSLLELGCGLGLPSLVAARVGFAVTARLRACNLTHRKIAFRPSSPACSTGEICQRI